MSTVEPYLFISHATEDSDFATQVDQKLQEAGFSTWIDSVEIDPGSVWSVEIDDALSSAFAIIVIVSPDSAKSEYVTYEWAFEIGRGRPAIPLLLRATNYHPRLESLQYLDFSNLRTRPWNVLIEHLREERERWLKNGAESVVGRQKIHAFEEGSDQFKDFFAEWYARSGFLTVFCMDLDWLASEDSRPVVEALRAKKEKLHLFLRNDATDQVSKELVANGARFTPIPDNIRSKHRMSILDNDGIQSIIIRNKDVSANKIVFAETDSYHDPHLIALALDVMDNCGR